MTFEEFLLKYDPPPGIEKMVNYERGQVEVHNFPIYDPRNNADPPVVKIKRILEENPEWWSQPWYQQGPCSNWGVSIWRWQTEEETHQSILRQMKARSEAHELRQSMIKDLDLDSFEMGYKRSPKTYKLDEEIKK